MAYNPITNQQYYNAQNAANTDAQLARNQASRRFGGGATGGTGDRGVAAGSQLTAIGTPKFDNTLNALDPTGRGNFTKDLQETTAILQPESTADKILQGVSLAASIAPFAALGGAAVAPLAASAGGGVAGGAITGAAAGIGGGAATGLLTSGTSGGAIGKDALKGGLTGAVTGGLNGLNSTGLGLPQPLTGAAGGAVKSAITGGNPLVGALSGAGSGLGAMTGIAGASQLGGMAGTALGNEFMLPSIAGASPGVMSGLNSGMSAIGQTGNIAGNNMAAGQSTTNSGTDLGGAINTGLGIGTTLLGSLGNAQNANAVGNVLSNAQAGTGVGTNTSYTGPNATGAINNGQVSNQLGGGLNLANTQLGNFANQQAAIATGIGGQTPAPVQSAINQAGTNVAGPTSTNPLLGQQYGNQQAVEGAQAGLIGQGQNVLNNPNVGAFNNAAATQLNTAGSDFTNTFNNSLTALNKQLELPTQQAESELANSQFGRGQLGTSGGALQTQAFATGLGQAYLGNQQTAFNEAMNAQNSATSNAGILQGAGNNVLATGNNLLANAFGQFNNTSQLGTNTANSIFGQNSNISQLGEQYGQNQVNNATLGQTLPATLAGQYGANANAAITGGITGANNIANSGTTAALAAGTQQGNQYNNANFASGSILNSRGFGQYGQNGLASIGAGIGSALGSNGVGGGIGNLISGALGGNPAGNMEIGAGTGTGDGTLPVGFDPNAGSSPMPVDLSGLNQIPSFDPSEFDLSNLNFGS